MVEGDRLMIDAVTEETLDMGNEEQEEKECDDSISSDMYESANKKISLFYLWVLSPWSFNCTIYVYPNFS